MTHTANPFARRTSCSARCPPPIPRNQAALPTKLFEYVALGIPVVSARLDAIQEYFSDAEITYFEAGDVEALATALRATANDSAAVKARAEAARRRYDGYRWSVASRDYIATLDRLCLQ